MGLAAIAFVVGLAVGGFAPRADLRAVQVENEQLRERASGLSPGQRITDLLTGGGLSGGGWRDAPVRPVAGVAPDELEVDAPTREPRAGGGARPASAGGSEEEAGGGAMASPFEDLEVAAEALELRRAQAREALVQATGADAEEMAVIDAAVDAMNDRLVAVAYDLAEAAAGGGDPDRRTMMIVASEALNALVDAEDAMRSVFPEIDLDEEVVNPAAFLDPAILDVMFADPDGAAGEAAAP